MEAGTKLVAELQHKMNQQLETFTNPQTAIVTTTTISTANIMGFSLPEVINVATVIYLVLLISHKGWQMYKEWKEEKQRERRE